MIELKEVDFGYGAKRLFQGLSLRLEESNIYGLLGLNGAGKSTLLRLLSGQLKPVNGSISINGHNPFERDPNFLGDLFFVPEEFTLPSLKGKEYLTLNAPFYPRFDHKRFEENCTQMELDRELLNSKLSSLSFGQKKKFMLAFALAAGTRYLLLDEPTNGMDIPGKDRMRQVIAGGLQEDQIILISTHQVRDLERLMEPVIIVDRGKVLYQGRPDDLSGRYSFKMVQNDPDPATVLYSEPIPGGTAVVERGEGKPAPDLEFLFKSFVLSGGAFTNYLNEKEAGNE